MATVVQMPKMGALFDDNLVKGVENYVALRTAKEDAEATENILKAITQAPDRQTALSVMASAAGKIRDAGRLSVILKAVDDAHPPGNEELQQGKLYSPVTGAEQTFYFKKGDFDKVQDPNFVSEITGREPGSFTLEKPGKIFDYVDPVSGQSVGTFVPGMQPQGTITSEDFTRRRQIEADERATDAAERQDKRLDLEGRRVDAIERRTAAQERKAAQTEKSDKEEKRISTEESRAERYYAKIYGARMLQDGSLDLSSLDEPKRQKFQEDFDRASELLHEGKAKTYGQAVRLVAKERKEGRPSGTTPPIVGDDQKGGGPELPKGSKVDSAVMTVTIKGKTTKVHKVLDASGKLLGYQPVKE